VQVVRVLSLLVLAGFLGADAFGLLAMVLVVTGALDLLVDLGTGQAIVQRKQLGQRLASSVFWANAAIGVAAALAMFVLGAAIAAAFAEPELRSLVRRLAPVFLLSSLGVVHAAMLQRDMRFAALSRVRLSSALANAGVACTMAYHGCGVWSLIGGYYGGTLVATAGYWLASGWRPSFCFDLDELRGIARFSLNLTAANLANWLFAQADALLIGRFVGAEPLGYWSLAKRIVLQPVLAVCGAIGDVLFAKLAPLQADDDALRREYLRVAPAAAMVLVPGLCGLAVLAGPLVLALIGFRFAPVGPLVACLVPVGVCAALLLPSGAIVRAKGRTDLILRWGMVRNVVTTAALAFGVGYGAVGVAIGLSAAAVALLLPSLWIALRTCGLGVGQALAPLRPVLVAVAVSTAGVHGARDVLLAADAPDVVVVVVGALCGMALWCLAFVGQCGDLARELATRVRARLARRSAPLWGSAP
jgi:PST family polysaccharide transporter